MILIWYDIKYDTNDINKVFANDNAPSFKSKAVLLVIQLSMDQTAKKKV